MAVLIPVFATQRRNGRKRAEFAWKPADGQGMLMPLDPAVKQA
jgi:hypothetical protein